MTRMEQHKLLRWEDYDFLVFSGCARSCPSSTKAFLAASPLDGKIGLQEGIKVCNAKCWAAAEPRAPVFSIINFAYLPTSRRKSLWGEEYSTGIVIIVDTRTVQ